MSGPSFSYVSKTEKKGGGGGEGEKRPKNSSGPTVTWARPGSQVSPKRERERKRHSTRGFHVWTADSRSIAQRKKKKKKTRGNLPDPLRCWSPSARSWEGEGKKRRKGGCPRTRTFTGGTQLLFSISAIYEEEEKKKKKKGCGRPATGGPPGPALRTADPPAKHDAQEEGGKKRKKKKVEHSWCPNIFAPN